MRYPSEGDEREMWGEKNFEAKKEGEKASEQKYLSGEFREGS